MKARPLSRSLEFVRHALTPDRLAALISLLGVLVSYLVADRVYERMPHIEDEAAYVWQARVIAQGRITLPTPPHRVSYLVPFVVDYNGQRFGKYPPGWPALLAVGVKLGVRAWINPLLAGLGVWLTYLLGKRIFGKLTGLLAAVLTVSSPFFLMNSGSLLSHPFGLVLTAAFALGWFNLFDGENDPNSRIADPQPPIQYSFVTLRVLRGKSLIYLLLAGLSLGLLALTRPYTALAVAAPFGLHGLYLLARGGWEVRRRVLGIGLIALACVGLYLLWQKTVTGNYLTNPYVLWWPYDKIGFGKGYGVLPEGHNWAQAVYNTKQSLKSGASDLFGWGSYSWIFIPFGMLAALLHGRRRREAWMLFGVAACLVVFYMAYWIGSELYGPRYYYEGLLAMTLLSGAGIAWLAGEKGVQSPSPFAFFKWGGDRGGVGVIRAVAVGLLLAGLVGYNLAVYLPKRLEGMHGLYGLNRGIIRNFLSASVQGAQPIPVEAVKPAIIIVHSKTWHFYGALLELENPNLTTPFVFAWSDDRYDALLYADFPGRRVYHYYPEDPGILYLAAKK